MSNESAAPRLFARWERGGVPEPLVVEDHDDRQCRESLRLVMRQFGAALGAAATLLTMRSADGAGDGTILLFDETPDRRQPDRPSAAAMAAAAPLLADEADAEPDILHRGSVRIDGEELAVLRLPLTAPDRTRYQLIALVRDDAEKACRVAERALRVLHPILAGYLSLWSFRARLRRRVSGLVAALNRSDVGVVLLGEGSDILFSNTVATRLLDDGNGIRRAGSSVGAVELGDAVRLQVAIAHVLGDSGAGIAKSPVVALRRGGQRRPLLAAVMPARCDEAAGCDAAAILYLFDPDADFRVAISAACKLYGLSPVETNLAGFLVEGSSLAEAAGRMRVKEQTARTYLKQIFLKTSSARQADLVRLMLSSMVRTAGPEPIEII